MWRNLQTPLAPLSSSATLGNRCVRMYVPLLVASILCGLLGIFIGLRFQRRSDSLLLLSESIPQLVYVGDPDGRVIYLNRQWSKYAGVPTSKLNREGWLDLIHPEDLAGFNAERTRVRIAGGDFEYRLRLRRHDGLYRWFFIKSYAHRERSGKVTRWFGTYTDVHDQIVDKERLELVLASSNIGIWEVDFSTGLVTRSDRHDFLYGYDRVLESWSFDQFLGAVHPEDRDGLRDHLERLARSGESDYSGEFRIVWPDGSVHWLASRARYVRDEFGTPTHVRGIIWDVTDVKMAQAEAEAAASAKSQFLANVSHELRTPLGAILGFQKMLREPELTEPERENYHAIIERNGQALLRLIDDVLDLSKVEAGALGIEVGPIALKAAIRDVVSAFEPQLNATGNSLLVKVSDDAPSALVSDPLRFRQILTNLISNAMKFTKAGEIRLEVLPMGESLTFDVVDSGAGIDRAVQSSLFKPFRQGDETITRRYGGTGLGLALSRELARALGGDVVLVESSPGQGSRFRLQLPLVEGINVSPLEPHAAPISRANALDGYSILVVEDSPDNQLLMKRALQRAGAAVELASNGLEGVDRALNEDFDLVLMDMQMPVMDGVTATKSLRSKGYTRPIFALTAHAMKEQRDSSFLAGCDEHVVKPVDIGALTDLIVSKVKIRTGGPSRAALSEAQPASRI